MLENKIAVVTGGTRGIGYATVKAFLREGARVILWGSKEDSARAAVERLRHENPVSLVTGMAPNLLDWAEVGAAFKEIKDKYGRVDILVNNAGITVRDPIQTHLPEDFDRVIALNLGAVYACTRAAALLMQDQGGGVILNTSSMVSLYGQSTGCAYPASKWAVNGLTKSLARELGKFGIRVNAVAPGVIRTHMVEGLPAKVVEHVVSTIPLGRMGDPEDVAEAFAFLASDRAAYITGAVLSVDGAAVV